MSEKFTKRNHYNPCFWTGLWNPSYFDAVKRGVAGGSRSQLVFALGVQANKIYETTVENVHFLKNLGIAEITPESMKEFCKKRFPDQYEGFALYVDTNPVRSIQACLNRQNCAGQQGLDQLSTPCQGRAQAQNGGWSRSHER